MFVKLRDNFIVLQSPIIPLLIDVENETHSNLTSLESSLLGLLDGSRTKDEIADLLLSQQTVGKSDTANVIQSLNLFFNKFADVIEQAQYSSLRKQIYYGDSSYAYPYELSLEITDKCVMQCIHCYKECSHLKNTFIEYNALVHFLEKLVGKIYTVQITGGEAMLHPDFARILTYCKEHFPQVTVSTTGLLITPQNVDLFRGVHVYLSIYSFDAAQNEKCIKNDSLSQIIKASQILVSSNIHTCINTIACDRNILEMQSFISECEKLGVNGVGIGKIVKVGRGKHLNKCEMCSVQCDASIAEIEESFSSSKMYLSTFINSSSPAELHCGLYKWVVNEKGEILPCAFFPSEFFALGKITDSPCELLTISKLEKMLSNLVSWKNKLRSEGINIEEICPTLCLVKNYE